MEHGAKSPGSALLSALTDLTLSRHSHWALSVSGIQGLVRSPVSGAEEIRFESTSPSVPSAYRLTAIHSVDRQRAADSLRWPLRV